MRFKKLESGVYAIKDMGGNVIYVGKSMDLKARYHQHLRGFETGTHDNKALLEYVSKIGLHKFDFYIIQFCEPASLDYNEQFFISRLLPAFNKMHNAKTDDAIAITEFETHVLNVIVENFKNEAPFRDLAAIIRQKFPSASDKSIGKAVRILGFKTTKHAVNRRTIVKIEAFVKPFTGLLKPL